ncbi:MAG: transposase [Gammaproteobacteria bacterium]|nr:transposase [Gammaproteobacteria bacterium]
MILAKESRPSLSYTAIHRIAQAVPLTRGLSNVELVSKILQSHGYGLSDIKEDLRFWGRIQRTLQAWASVMDKALDNRDLTNRKGTFFIDQDICHKRLELMREIFFDQHARPREVCMKYGISIATFYRLVEDYKLYGPWAVIPGYSPGKEGLSSELQLTILLEKLRHPGWSPELIVKNLKLKVSRYAVHRVLCRWGLDKRDFSAVALDEYLGKDSPAPPQEPYQPRKAAYHIVSEKVILSTRRINRHFEGICQKMKIRPFHICDPGPFLLAPFVSDLGVVQAFETYGPPKLRGKEVTNLALLNVFRILAGYRRINHLSNNRDRAVALASGVGMYGSTSRYYEDTINFQFDQLHELRCDLVARAVELGLIEGLKIGFDFHFKEFYGKHAWEKQIGKGPDKAGDMVAGFRPHVAWDLASNVIISMAYFQGGARAPRILRQFCEQNIFPILDPLAIQEIYMDSEYTKEGDFHYLKEVTCKNGDIYICLKKNKQIKKLIQPALEEKDGWEPYEDEDEAKAIQIKLPKTGLPFLIVILRERKNKENIRCFGSTHVVLSKTDILRKYRYRWLIENGLKDLVASYFVDEIYGEDPEKIEFEFYCVMVARLAYEYFLRELNGKYLNNVDGNKCTLQKMRNLLFEKRNCTIEQDDSGNFILTLLDSSNSSELEKDVSKMLISLKDKGNNKVLWWNNRGVYLRSLNQYNL